ARILIITGGRAVAIAGFIPFHDIVPAKDFAISIVVGIAARWTTAISGWNTKCLLDVKAFQAALIGAATHRINGTCHIIITRAWTVPITALFGLDDAIATHWRAVSVIVGVAPIGTTSIIGNTRALGRMAALHIALLSTAGE
ncbi:MAG: hypothetical protein CME13_05515, partial [Gemmatimonadetes bacterium]|nr:hypothetical protein [Gemmatimonadota bacterium]